MPWSRRPSVPLRLAAAAACVLALAAPGPSAAQAAAAAASAPIPASVSPAASRLDQVIASGVLRVGTTGDYKPFTYRVANGNTFIGLDIALAVDLARQLGVKLEIVPTTWTTLMPDFADGRFDVAMGGISISLERQKKAYFSIPYLRDGKTPIVRCEDIAKYQTLAQIDRPEVRLIVNPGGTNERFARARAPHATLAVWPDNVTIFDRIAAADADVMITDAIEARLQARLHPKLCAVHPDAPFDFSEKAVLLPRDEPLRAFVDQWLHQALASGTLDRLHEQWLAYPWGVESLRQLVDARLLLAPEVAQYKWNHHLPIEDREREAQLIAELGQRADALGVPRDWAERFFLAQIEASKIAQNELFQGWDVFKRGQFPDAPDLATVTRPKIDKLNDQLLHALAESWPVLSDPRRQADIARAMHPMAAEDLSARAVNAAIAPLTR